MAPRLLIFVLAVCCLAGCGTARHSQSGAPATSSSEDLDYLDGEAEERAEAHARYANGVLADLNGRSKEAAEEFFKAALADSTNEQLVQEVSRRLFQEKMYPEAVELLTEATSSKNVSGALYARLGLAYALNGQKEQALRANRKAIHKAPEELAGYRHLAQLHLQMGKEAKAFDVLNEAAAQKNADVPFLLELADLYMAFGKVTGTNSQPWKARAVATLDRARQEEPKNPMHLQKLAEAYHAAGQETAAQELLVQLLETLPDVPGVRERLIEIYLRKQETERAAPLLEKLVKDNPTNPQAHYFLGAIAMERGALPQAVEHLNRAIILNPNLEPAYYDLAGAHIGLNRAKKALDILQEARQRFQRKFALEYYTGLAYNRLKDYTSALTHFTAAEVIARATEPERLTHTFYFQLGAVSERNQQFEEAERHFRKCLDLDPNFSEAMNYLGYMWAERDTHLAEARELIEKAVQIEPDNAAYLDSLGWVLFKLGETEKALQCIQSAIEKSKEPDATLLDHLGDIQFRLNEVDKARQAWKKSLELEPNEAIEKKLLTSGTPKS